MTLWDLNKKLLLLQNFAEDTMNELLGWYGYEKPTEHVKQKLKRRQLLSPADNLRRQPPTATQSRADDDVTSPCHQADDSQENTSG